MGKRKLTYEELLPQWSMKNSGKLSDYTKGSGVSVLWVCEKGHEYPSRIKRRYAGDGCPFCSGRNVIKGENDLATKRPDIAKEWHPDMNGDLTPSDVKCGSGKEVIWLCPYGHDYPAKIRDRTAKRSKGCPYCASKKIWRGDPTKVTTTRGLSLKVMYPELAKQWDYELNDTDPDDYFPHSNKHIHWICERGHRWPAQINSRTREERPNECPFCSGKLPIPGETDLATTDPDIAATWNFELNTISASEVLRTSHDDAFWDCPKRHIFKMRIANRTKGEGCSVCAGKRGAIDYRELLEKGLYRGKINSR
ncbi:MAG: zinc-ribbon domain-containing protein [Lachnospiraceae bacterium]|nr:zinc-ribbon domain-containing protein [Lachnospiraceae bacterium]